LPGYRKQPMANHLNAVSMNNPRRIVKLSPKTYFTNIGVSTNIGRRPSNQDAVLVTGTPLTLGNKGRLFAVADGMGGHAGGSIASHLACDGLYYYYERETNKQVQQSPMEIGRCLTEVIIRIDRHIRLQGLKHSKLAEMGTTLSCLVITDSYSIIAHVGDTRIYRLRDGHLACLTVDHTFVQDMIFEGEVNPAQAHLHPLRHMLTRVVGTQEPLTFVDSRIDPLKIKDCFLLCSDGLYNALSDAYILDLLSNQSIASKSAEELVAQALREGARDNITAIVIRIEGPDNDFSTSGE
jgi:serine/threonine protein phosphatase PrpC